MQVSGGDTAAELLGAHGDEVWAFAVRCTATRAAAVEVLVAALRCATERIPVLVAVARLSRPLAPIIAASGLTRLDGLDRHRPVERDVLVLVGLAHLSAAEAARALGLRRATVRRALLAVLPEPEPVGPLSAELRAELVARASLPGPRGPLPSPHRRRPRGRAVLAAVLAALALGVSVVAVHRSDPARSGLVPVAGGPDGLDTTPSPGLARLTADNALAAQVGIPASGNLVLDQHLARCARAVRTTGNVAQYPPFDTWRLGTNQVGATGITSAVSDAFVCATTPTTVYVSATAGVAVGELQLVRAGPGQLGLLNPRGRAVTLSLLGAPPGPTPTASAEPVQLVGVRTAPSAPFGLAVTGPGLPAAGVPLPDPGPTAVRLVDNRLSPPDRTSDAGARLGRCLGSPFGALTADPDAWNPTTAGTVADTSIVVAHAFGAAGVCAEHDGQQVFASFPAEDPVPAGALTAITQIGAVGGDPWSYTVFSVDVRAVALTAETSGRPVLCFVASGVGVCAQAAGSVDAVVLSARDAGGTLVAGPTA